MAAALLKNANLLLRFLNSFYASFLTFLLSTWSCVELSERQQLVLDFSFFVVVFFLNRSCTKTKELF